MHLIQYLCVRVCLSESHPCSCLSHCYQGAVFCEVRAVTLCHGKYCYCVMCCLWLRSLREGAVFVTVSGCTLCEIQAEAEERVEHVLHNAYNTTCCQQSDFGVE
jgi:hypothetical protein